MPKILEASNLRMKQNGTFFNLSIQTAYFPINYAVLITNSPLLFFLLTQSTSVFRQVEYLLATISSLKSNL